MRRVHFALLCATVMSLGYAVDASARPGFGSTLPAGATDFASGAGCTFCHTSETGGSPDDPNKGLSEFGLWIRDQNMNDNLYVAADATSFTFNWEPLGSLDFDMDGTSNNDELNATPPTDPRDAASAPGAEPAPTPADNGSDTTDDDDGGCTVSAPSRSASPVGGVAALSLGLLVGLRRRRR